MSGGMFPEPSESSLVRDGDGDVWQRVTAGEHVGWVQLAQLDPSFLNDPLPWHKLAPHVTGVLVPLPGLVPEDLCPTCAPPCRETVGMVCQTCGADYLVGGACS